MTTVEWTGDAGLTLYWFPTNQSLSDWETYKVEAVESPAGTYTASLDETLSNTFYLFVGSTQPSSVDVNLGIYQFSTDSTTTSSDATSAREFSQSYGPKRVKTPNMEVEQFDPLTAQKALERQSVVSPSLASFGVTIVSPNIPRFRRHRP